MRDHWSEIDGLRWYARVFGPLRRTRQCTTAAPVVLVHGLGVSGRYFVPLARRLERNFRVYVPDMPGHGRTATPRDALDVTGLADALARWLSESELTGASAVANSLGCQVVVELARRHPGLLCRLALLGPTLAPELRNPARLLARFAGIVPLERPALIPIVARDYLRMLPRFPAEYRAMRRHRLERRMADLDLPVLLVRGEHDGVSPGPWVAELAARARACGVVVVPGGGHAVHFSRPDAVAGVLRPFLESRRSGAALKRASAAGPSARASRARRGR